MTVSVIVPVWNGGEDLAACLKAIAAWPEPPFELLVADDGSTDGSIAIAQAHGARIASSGGVRLGPARARNAGAALAQGEILFFLDADVCPHPDALHRVREAFRRDPDLAAVIGAYDETPLHPRFFSQYKNLQHCFVHRQGRRAASTFWTGCGAIRRPVFLELGGFDVAAYPRPSIEDIELGYRLIARGRRIELDPAIQVRHRKQWTFESMVRTDFRDRAVPWTLLLLRTSSAPPNDLNLQTSQRISAALTGLLGLFIAATPVFAGARGLAGWLLLIYSALSASWSERGSARPARKFAVSAIWAAFTAALCGFGAGLDAIAVLVLALPVIHAWLPRIAPATMLAGLGAAAWLLAGHPAQTAGLALLAAILALNWRFYEFLAAKRGVLFAVAAMPVHLLYFIYSMAGFLTGQLLHRLNQRAA